LAGPWRLAFMSLKTGDLSVQPRNLGALGRHHGGFRGEALVQLGIVLALLFDGLGVETGGAHLLFVDKFQNLNCRTLFIGDYCRCKYRRLTSRRRNGQYKRRRSGPECNSMCDIAVDIHTKRIVAPESNRISKRHDQMSPSFVCRNDFLNRLRQSELRWQKCDGHFVLLELITPSGDSRDRGASTKSGRRDHNGRIHCAGWNAG
jgi:hypothetical protein